MPKNILIFADGTGQVGGVRPDQQLSNIYKLFRATRVGPDSPLDPKQQVAYYDPGLGTANPSGSVRLGVWQRLKSLAGLRVLGSMTMAAFGAEEQELRASFARARAAREALAAAGHPAGEISMGMSQDYEIAVEEGATLVRLGTILFGARETR